MQSKLAPPLDPNAYVARVARYLAAPRVLLVMIVRNEAQARPEPPLLAECLASARAVLGPSYAGAVIDDTGSEDATVQVCLETLAPHGAVCMGARPFDDFASARNAVLERAEEVARRTGATHLLMLSAGCIVTGELNLRVGDANAWRVGYHLGDLRYQKPSLFQVGAGWRYEGRVHETASAPYGRVSFHPSGLECVFPPTADAGRRARWERDLALLTGARSSRERFYLAQTLECLGRHAEAYDAYWERWRDTAGYQEERVVAMLRAIRIAPTLEMAVTCALHAERLDGLRGEGPMHLAQRAYQEAKTELHWALVEKLARQGAAMVPRAGSLFVDASREWRCHYLAGLSCYWRRQWARAAEYLRAALACEVGPRAGVLTDIEARIATCDARAIDVGDGPWEATAQEGR